MALRHKAEQRVAELEDEIMGVAFTTSEVATGRVGLRIKQLEGQLDLARQENRLLCAQIEEARHMAGTNRGLGKDLEVRDESLTENITRTLTLTLSLTLNL